MASARTKYVWQHMSNYYRTEQVLRNGPIHELPEQLDPAIDKISVRFSDGTTKTVEEYFNASTMDAMLVLRAGTQEDESLGAWVGRHITETFGES